MRRVFWAMALLLPCNLVGVQGRAGRPVAAVPVVRHWQLFADPNEGAFQLEMPQGWKLAGGTARRNALQYRGWALATSPDGATILAINDPAEPSYALPMFGFRPGSIYNGGGGTTYIVAPYQSGAQFASSWGQRKLRMHCTSIKVMSSRARPDLTEQINGFSRALGISHDYGEATLACDKDGMAMTAYVFASTTLIRTSAQTGLWYGDTIESFLAPGQVAGLAAGLLAHMVKSVRVSPAWLARQSQTAVRVSQIATQTNAQISDSIMQGWAQRGAAMDRVMDEGSRARLGLDVYADPATGTQYTVANTYQYYWANARGTVVGTNTDTPPDASFSPLKRVPPQ